MDDLQEFENQLKQEAEAQRIREEDPNTIRRDADGTVYEFDSVRKAWFPKIDEDFLAKYQMNYGTTANDSTPDSSKVAFDWRKPPSDINSEEYRIWYQEYCKYIAFYQNYNASIPSANIELPETTADTNSSSDEESVSSSKIKANKKEKQDASKEPAPVAGVKRPSEPAWFDIDDSKNTTVYVTGLPYDTTDDEFKEVMSKVGLIAFDPILRAPKLKLYRDSNGEIKGDGRCSYMKLESVELALTILDGYEIRRGQKLKVEKAVFTQKGDYDPKRKKRKLTREEKKKFQEKQDYLLAWLPPKPKDSRPKFERICVIKNVFLPKEINDDPSLFNEIRLDMMEECKKFGEVKKVTVYDRNEEGVVTVTFKTPEDADKCVQALHGRWFAKRQLVACNWDGKTKYSVLETEQEMEERLKKWHSFLEQGEGQTPNKTA